jgi:hypothetical protein
LLPGGSGPCVGYPQRQAKQTDDGAGALQATTPDQVVAEPLNAVLAKDKPAGRAGPCDITRARLIADRAKEVS